MQSSWENLAPHLVITPRKKGEAAPTRQRDAFLQSGVASSANERKRKQRTKQKDARLGAICILDMETDPFDQDTLEEIHPFLAVLYSDDFEPIVIWEDDFPTFVDALLDEIMALPKPYTIYAHNGGKFDFMFLISRLRGSVKFKGRGIMCAKIGNHEIRDSFHIIPEKLANWKKDSFDYSKLSKRNRKKWRDEIVKYCINDCKYLLEIVRKFLQDFGFKISIGQAAMAELRKHYRFECLGEKSDEFLRQWFFGGRVECIMGKGHFFSQEPQPCYKLYDVNSMYPYVMANYQHPISSFYMVREGEPNAFTYFLEIECDNYGGLVAKGGEGETTSEITRGIFKTTIWEYRVALKYGLIDNVKILRCIDFERATDFSKFIIPLYDNRLRTKAELAKMKAAGDTSSHQYEDTKKDDIFYKLIMNNAYGKFAQNPRNFKETFLTDHGKFPTNEAGERDETYGDFPKYECETYDIWEKPTEKLKFNNVATAASITGAARAVLLEAMMNADDPIYCDTDSLICRGLHGVPIDKTALGAWDIEAEFKEVIILGKKLYACLLKSGEDTSIMSSWRPDRTKLRAKGVSDLRWSHYLAMLEDQVVEALNKSPTMTKTGNQFYMRRRVRSTAPLLSHRRIDAAPLRLSS